jgi:LIM and senescent cell antigen-like-containing domain protein 1/2
MDLDEDSLRFKGNSYHPYHFNCKTCAVELTHHAREVKNELYCVKCYEKLDIAVCGACHKLIDQERIVNALGKQWHVEVI